jgi:Holliday junction resolvasome RuvABC endonuclease subunit
MIKNEQNELPNITRDDVVALDIATLTGFYSTHDAGTWNFHKKSRENDCIEMEKFYNTVKDFILKYNIKQVVAEDVNVNNHFTDIRKLCEFRGVLKLICSQLGLPDPKYVNVRTVKKWATGNGNADKKMMIEFCQKRWGIDPVDDNMADATHIFKYYVRIYKL